MSEENEIQLLEAVDAVIEKRGKLSDVRACLQAMKPVSYKGFSPAFCAMENAARASRKDILEVLATKVTDLPVKLWTPRSYPLLSPVINGGPVDEKRKKCLKYLVNLPEFSRFVLEFSKDRFVENMNLLFGGYKKDHAWAIAIVFEKARSVLKSRASSEWPYFSDLPMEEILDNAFFDREFEGTSCATAPENFLAILSFADERHIESLLKKISSWNADARQQPEDVLIKTGYLCQRMAGKSRYGALIEFYERLDKKGDILLRDFVVSAGYPSETLRSVMESAIREADIAGLENLAIFAAMQPDQDIFTKAGAKSGKTLYDVAREFDPDESYDSIFARLGVERSFYIAFVSERMTNILKVAHMYNLMKNQVPANANNREFLPPAGLPVLKCP